MSSEEVDIYGVEPQQHCRYQKGPRRSDSAFPNTRVTVVNIRRMQMRRTDGEGAIRAHYSLGNDVMLGKDEEVALTLIPHGGSTRVITAEFTSAKAGLQGRWWHTLQALSHDKTTLTRWMSSALMVAMRLPRAPVFGFARVYLDGVSLGFYVATEGSVDPVCAIDGGSMEEVNTLLYASGYSVLGGSATVDDAVVARVEAALDVHMVLRALAVEAVLARRDENDDSCPPSNPVPMGLLRGLRVARGGPRRSTRELLTSGVQSWDISYREAMEEAEALLVSPSFTRQGHCQREVLRPHVRSAGGVSAERDLDGIDASFSLRPSIDRWAVRRWVLWLYACYGHATVESEQSKHETRTVALWRASVIADVVHSAILN